MVSDVVGGSLFSDLLQILRKGGRLVTAGAIAGPIVPLDLRARTDVVVREGLLTGEPHPVARRSGDVVLAGSTVEKGRLVGTVERVSGATVAAAGALG